MGKSFSKKRKLDAENAYMSGATIPEIARYYEISPNIVYRWAANDGWHKRLFERHQQIQKTLFQQLTEQVTQSVQRYMQCSILIGQLAAMALGNIYEKCRSGEVTPESQLRDIAGWSSVAERGSRIYRNAIPEASEKVSDKILEELKNINVALQGAREVIPAITTYSSVEQNNVNKVPDGQNDLQPGAKSGG